MANDEEYYGYELLRGTSRKPQSKPQANGDCYEAAGKYILAHPNDGLILVHAEVMGQGKLDGISFGHAFIVDGENVIDKSNGRNIQMPKSLYFAIGQIYDLDNFYQYDYKAAQKKILDLSQWGPWDLQTRSGL